MNYRILLFSSIFFMCGIFFMFIIDRLQLPQIKLGTSYWLGYNFLYYLRDSNYLGKDFEALEFNSASEVIRAYRNGVINSLCLTPDEVLKNFRDEDPYTVIMAIAVSEGADVIISTKDIKEPSMLKGKRIGLEDTALGGYILKRFLEVNNIDEKEIFIVHLEPHEHYKSFAEQTVDAIITYEPTASRILKEIGGNVIFSSKEIPEEIFDFVLVKREFLLKNKKQVKALIDEYFQIVEDYFSNKDFYNNQMVKNYRISKDTLEKIFENESVRFLDREMNRELLMTDELEKKLRKMEKYFSLKKKIDYSKLLDKAIIRELYDTKSAKNSSEI